MPWSQEKNIGKAYNEFMELLPEEDYACFCDGDTMFLTSNYGAQLYDMVNKYPECEIFTCKTNRIGCIYQRELEMWWENNILMHDEKAALLSIEKYDHVKDISALGVDDPMGGVMILISKRVWRAIGGFKDGMLGVDNDIHWKAIGHGEKVYMMEGVYLFHKYRNGYAKNNQHLR